jgi:soluble lytic murein transglycosylase-like protein
MALQIASSDPVAELGSSRLSQRQGGAKDPKWKAALDFESMFLGQLMKGMRQSIGKDESGEVSKERQMFTEMLDQQYASLSSRSTAHLNDNAPEQAKSGNLKSLAAQIYRSMIQKDVSSSDIPFSPLPTLPYAPTRKPEGNAAGLGSIQLNPKALQVLAESAGKKHGLPAELIRSVIQTESAGHVDAVSSAGAKGLMQIMDTTAADLGLKNSFDPEANVDAGVRYLKSLVKRFGGDLEKALAGYNAGPGAVEKHGGIPPFPETQNYVKQVLRKMKQFSGTSENSEGQIP